VLGAVLVHGVQEVAGRGEVQASSEGGVTEKRIANLLGGYEVTIYPTAFGEFSRTDGANGPAIRLLGSHIESPCTHYATAREARDAAAALLEIADEIEAAGSA
jgi:hypothetical protein